jgi:sugar lactone lactonase YvrE
LFGQMRGGRVITRPPPTTWLTGAIDVRGGDETRDAMPQDGQHVYFLPADRRQLVRVTEDLQKPNGVIGTPDGETLFESDIGAGKTHRYDIAPSGPPTIREPRWTSVLRQM